MGRNNNKKGLSGLLDQLSDHTAIQPDERLRLETNGEANDDDNDMTCRVIDLVTPLGKGQRVLLPSPPKAGKTMILQKIARAVKTNHPDVKQFALLIDERVEEVTDFRRNIPIEVRASSIDQHPDNHVKTAEETFEEAIKLLFQGRDVLILLDSLTRLARTYNKTHKHQGRTLSGGLSAGALDRPRQLFGTARNLEGGGSLTVIASTLVDTGSRMDEVIFQEFKGTGNAELVLNRELAEHRLWPAVDIEGSGTRQERGILTQHEYDQITNLRRQVAGRDPKDALKFLQTAIRKSDNNDDLLRNL